MLSNWFLRYMILFLSEAICEEVKNGRKSHITPPDSIANHLLPAILKFAAFASTLNKQTTATNKQTNATNNQVNNIANHLLVTFIKLASFPSTAIPWKDLSILITLSKSFLKKMVPKKGFLISLEYSSGIVGKAALIHLISHR